MGRTPFGTAVMLGAVAAVAAVCHPIAQSAPHLQALRELGRPPVDFVVAALDTRDLVIFDDGLHGAQEPFDFYGQLLDDPRARDRVSIIFFELFSTTAQPDLDAYFASADGNADLLARAFQDDFSGYGLRLQSYVDLLAKIWTINRALPAGRRIRVVGVNQPIYWEAIHNRRDYDLFQATLSGRDYFMYRAITDALNGFRDGRKALFLTNTRHAYKAIRDRTGRVQQNCAAFFELFEPGKAMTVRLHNVALRVDAPAVVAGPRTTEGLEEAAFRWVRMEEGAWDRAFEDTGRRPIAIAIAGTPFGAAPFIGNTMLDAAPNQTMANAYDALIFLAAIDRLHLSATTGRFYTAAFKREVKRRVEILEEGRLASFLERQGAATLDQFVDLVATPRPVTPNTLLGAGGR